MSFGSLPSVLGNGGGVAISVIGGTGLFADGTAAAPSISFASDTDTGFYRDSANLLGFSTGGAGSLRFGSAGTVYGAAVANYVRLNNSGAVELAAAGTGQNITLTPSDGLVVGGISNVGGSITSGFRATNGAAAGSSSAIAGFSCQIPLVSSNVFQFFTRSGKGFIGQDAVVDHITLFAGANGRVGIGTQTDSGALLQIGGATSNAAGGMVFGPDTFLYREGSSAGMLKLVGTGGGGFIFQSTGSLSYYGGILISAQQRALIISQSGYDVIRTNGFAVPSELQLLTTGTIALTLDASQAATFSAAAGATFVAKFNHVGGTNPVVLLQEGGVSKAQWSSFSGDVYFDSLTAGKSVVFRSGAQVTALSLDASQNAIFAGTVKPILATTAGAPAYVKGAIYFDTTLNKLRVGGATAWETITSA